jgi:flagellin
MTIGNSINMLSLNLQQNLAKLSLAEKLDDSGDESLYREMESSISSKGAEVKNLNNAVGFMQVADGALSSLSDQNMKLEELSVARGDATLNASQRSMIDSQMADIQKSMSRTVNESSYNGMNVFNSGAFSDSGVNISIDANEMDISDANSIKKFQDIIDNHRSDIGSFVNASRSEIENLSTSIVNESASKSYLEVDFAKEAMDFANNKTKLDAALVANSHNMDSLKNSVNSLLA